MERNDQPGASKLCNLTPKGNLDLNTTRSAIGNNNSRNQDRGLGEKQSHRPYSKNLDHAEQTFVPNIGNHHGKPSNTTNKVSIFDVAYQ